MSAYYDYTEDTIRAWLQEPINLPEQGYARVAELVHQTPQQRHPWPTFSTRRSQATFSAPRLVVAAVTFALVSGALLAGTVGPLDIDPVTPPGAVSESPSPLASTPSTTASPSVPPDTTTGVDEPSAGLPVAGKSEALNERSTVTYTIHPASGEIEVDTIFVLRTRQSPFPPKEWGPIVVEDRPRNPRVTPPFELVEGATSLPGLWKAVEVTTPRIDGGSQDEKFVLSYTVDASITQNDANKERTPARVDGSYLFFCVPGQDTDTGSVRIKVDGASRRKMTHRHGDVRTHARPGPSGP